jgi:hypothetical protein
VKRLGPPIVANDPATSQSFDYLTARFDKPKPLGAPYDPPDRPSTSPNTRRPQSSRELRMGWRNLLAALMWGCQGLLRGIVKIRVIPRSGRRVFVHT